LSGDDQKTEHGREGSMETKGWSVTLEASTDVSVDEQMAERLAEGLAPTHGNASVGDGRVGGTITVDAKDIDEAYRFARSVFDEVFGSVGIEEPDIESVELVREDEATRRLLESNFPELVGVAELADILGVTRQRASELARSKTFPHPVARLKSGPVWIKSTVARHAEGVPRRAGRPSVVADAKAILAYMAMNRSAHVVEQDGHVRIVDDATDTTITALSASDVRVIRNMLAYGGTGKKLSEIAKDAGITDASIGEVVRKIEALTTRRAALTRGD
jgi:hypothetical protein